MKRWDYSRPNPSKHTVTFRRKTSLQWCKGTKDLMSESKAAVTPSGRHALLEAKVTSSMSTFRYSSNEPFSTSRTQITRQESSGQIKLPISLFTIAESCIAPCVGPNGIGAFSNNLNFYWNLAFKIAVFSIPVDLVVVYL
jgi:hypothetical protein